MKKFYLFATSLALVFSSCSNNSNNSNPIVPEGDIKPLSLVVDIESTVSKSSPSSVSPIFANEVTTANLSQIGVHICEHQNFGTAYIDGSHNTTWTKVDNKWATSTPVFLGSDNANIYAYYPYNNNVNLNPSAVPVAIGDTDYLFGKAVAGNGTDAFVANNKNTSASIKMKHAMSQMVWNFTKEASYTGAANVTSISLNNLHKAGALNVENGTIATSGNGEAHTLNVNLNAPAKKNLMIFPTTYEAGALSMSFVIDGKEMTSTLGALDFERAKKYNFNVKVKGTGIVIESVVVEDWTVGADQDLEIN